MLPYFVFISYSAFFATFKPFSHGLRSAAVITGAIFFVGLRYQIGYDWIVYTELFEVARDVNSAGFFNHLPVLQLQVSFETGLLFLSSSTSAVCSEYVFFLVILHVFFLYCFWKFGRALGCENITATFLIVHLFLLISLEFSTMRQALAFGIFNLGIAKWLNGGRTWAVFLMLFAKAFQFTTILYSLAFLISLGANRQIWIIFLMGSTALVPIIAPTFFIQAASFVPGFIAEKIRYYLLERAFEASILDIVFFGFLFIFYLSYVSAKGDNYCLETLGGSKR